MEKINLPFFYQLGSQLNPLTKYNEKERLKRIDIVFACYEVQPSLISLFRSFSTLTVCRPVGQELLAVMKEVQDWLSTTPYEEQSKSDWSVDMKFRRVIEKAKEFEAVLSAELQTLATYHVTQKGIYSTTDLIERTENIFPDSVLKRINQEVREEVRQSGKCFAFDCATASAFHMMRATEAVMHEYYLSVVKPKPRSKKKLDSWGAYIFGLDKLGDPEVKEVVAMLRQIKDRHRNLIMHPEIVLTPDESFTLFEIAQGAIIAMANKLPAAKMKK